MSLNLSQTREAKKLSAAALLVSLATLGLVLSAIGASNIPTPPTKSETQLHQHGVMTFTINNGDSFSTATVNYPVVFSNTPNVSLSLPIGFQLWSASVPLVAYTFLATTGTIWVNMPIAQTEFFGLPNPCCRATLNMAAVSICQTTADIVTASTNASAYIGPQYSNNGGVSWTDVPSARIVFGTNTGVFNSGGFGFAGGTTTLTFRIVGGNGGGAGDVPSFGNVGIFCTAVMFSNSIAYTTTTSQLTVVLYYLAPQTNGGLTEKVAWDASACLSPGVKDC